MTKKKDPSQLKPKGRKPSPKSTAIEVQSRVNKIFELLIQGATRAQIHQYAASTAKNDDEQIIKVPWGLGERAIDEYISKANELFSEHSKVFADRETGKAILRYNQLYTRALKKGDLKSALSSQQALCALLGLNAPTKSEMTGKNGAPLIPANGIPDEEIEKRAREILAKRK
jgi:hypothetical protein